MRYLLLGVGPADLIVYDDASKPSSPKKGESEARTASIPTIFVAMATTTEGSSTRSKEGGAVGAFS
eukprot:1652247-Pyramimonas_sp.AAC.1